MMQLNENNFIERLLHKIPEIKQSYEDEIEWWDGEIPGLHNILGNVLDAYLVSLRQQNIWEFILKNYLKKLRKY